ncbi:alkaline phosphatase family protein [Parapedomonas caeni]
MAGRVLLVEFNELSPTLMNKWIAEGILPNFQRLRDRSAVYVTEPDETNPVNLEPWIQWYSLHTGLPFSQHGVFHLTDGPRAGHDDLFSLLLASGATVGCGGSMNVKAFKGEGSFFIADPWCDGQPAWPEDLNTFQRFVAQSVREHTNPAGSGGAVTPAQFVAFMARHGLSPATVASTVRQLLSEKMSDPKLNWKRPAILDRMNLDLFSHLYRRHRPAFATFFSNSTAHLQHCYWRHMEPDVFTIRPSDKELALYGDAVRFGYVEMDRMIGRLQALLEPGDLMLLATALSQQPFLRREADGGQLFYRPRAVETLLADLGVRYRDVEPVMTHQFMIRFESTDEAEAAAALLRGLAVDGKPLIGMQDHGAEGLYFGCQISRQIGPEAVITSAISNRSWRFFDWFYQIDGMKSGCHHPDGILWLGTGEHVDAGRCSILDVFPTVLEALGRGHLIPSDRTGRNLLPAPAARRAA